MKIGREIDHIVYCVPDLENGIDYIEELLGIRPVFGGRHLSNGTKNALLNLGDNCYLEILAVDDESIVLDSFRKILVVGSYSVDQIQALIQDAGGKFKN